MKTKMETYQDLYREAWIKQMEIDAVRNPLARNPNKNYLSRQKAAQTLYNSTHEED